MIKKFILWLKGSHAKRSAQLLESFVNIQKELQTINRDIVASHVAIKDKQLKLQEEEQILIATLAKNEKVATNISRLLGDE